MRSQVGGKATKQRKFTKEFFTMKKIIFFTPKGGVGKTTSVLELADKLCGQSKKVVMIDADPQCNLTTQLVGIENFRKMYKEGYPNIHSALSPCFHGEPVLIKSPDLVKTERGYLLCGSMLLQEYEYMLSLAQNTQGVILSGNLVGSFSYLFEKIEEKYNPDWMLIDVSPSIGAINQNLFLQSDSWIVPIIDDTFGVMTLDLLCRIIPTWFQQGTDMQSVFNKEYYPFKVQMENFLGFSVRKDSNGLSDAIADFHSKLGSYFKTFQR
jgi:cellulose biosynthesis protein BcsQ